jgi:predicted enzyme related to lactoylglutathione lyase
MTEQRTYPYGVPCWVDTEQPDPAGAQAFYGGLFGWEFEDVMPAGTPGFYLLARLDGQDVAAIGPDPGGAVGWNTYVAVDDADTTAAVVTRLGGSVVAAPEDAGPGGPAAICADPQGARFRLWQPRRRPGAQLVNAPGTWNFSNLQTPDPAGARTFYQELFGWEADEVGGGAAMWRRPGYGDHLAATFDPDIRVRQAKAPSGFADAVAWVAPAPGPPRWQVIFAVADRDGAVATAERLGGTVVGEPSDDQWTKTAVVRDPQGAELTLSQFAPADWGASGAGAPARSQRP